MRSARGLPSRPGSPDTGGGLLPDFLSRLLAQVKQTLVDQTVDAGKAAYVAGVRAALLIGVAVLLAGAAASSLLLRSTDDHVRPRRVLTPKRRVGREPASMIVWIVARRSRKCRTGRVD